MKKAIIIFCIAMVVVIALAQAIGDRDVIGELFPKTHTDADLIKAETINTNHLVSNGSTLAGVTWLGNGGKIGYMGNNDVHDVKNMIVNAYVDDSGNLILVPLCGDPIIFGGVTNE